MSSGSPNAFCDSSATGSFSAIANSNAATLFSVAITPQTVYPLLLATCGGFSFYAANAGVSYSSEYFRVTVAGAVFITGPNGYTSTGHFRYSVGLDPEDETNAFQQPYDLVELQVYAQETGLAAQPSNTAPAKTFKIKTQLISGNVFDDSLPVTTFSSRFRVLFTSVPSYYPAGANYLTGTGFTLPGGSGTGIIQLRSGTFATAFSPNQAATLYSVILDGQHKFPLLLCTSGDYSFYATNAGAFRGSWPPNGSCLAVGPNGYTAMGTFNYLMQGNADGTAFPGNCELYIYVNETNRFLAQPTNTAPEARL